MPDVKEPTGRVWQVMKRSAFNEDGSLWFPSRLTAQWLADQKAELKPYLFASQYLNEYISSEDRRFKPEWIKYKPFYLEYMEGRLQLVEEHDRDYRLPHIRPVNVFTCVDPAISDRKYADYTGITTVAVDEVLNFYVLDSRRVRGGAETVINETATEIKRWHSGVLGVETVAYQKALKQWMDVAFKDLGIAIGITELKSGTGTGKNARIENMEPAFATGRVWLRKGIAPTLEHELLNWRPLQDSGHDDLIDSLSFCMQVAYPATLGQAAKDRGSWHDMDPKEREKIRQKNERFMADMDRQANRAPVASNFTTGWEAPPALVGKREITKDGIRKFFEAWEKSDRPDTGESKDRVGQN
jgi:phage terminase large subunit-like protein